MTDCRHPNYALGNLRAPPEGDAVGQDGNVAVLVDCRECEETVLLRSKRVEVMQEVPGQ